MTCDHLLADDFLADLSITLDDEEKARVVRIVEAASRDPRGFTIPDDLDPNGDVAFVAMLSLVEKVRHEGDKWGITACSEPLRVALELIHCAKPPEEGAEGS